MRFSWFCGSTSDVRNEVGIRTPKVTAKNEQSPIERTTKQLRFSFFLAPTCFVLFGKKSWKGERGAVIWLGAKHVINWASPRFLEDWWLLFVRSSKPTRFIFRDGHRGDRDGLLLLNHSLRQSCAYYIIKRTDMYREAVAKCNSFGNKVRARKANIPHPSVHFDYFVFIRQKFFFLINSSRCMYNFSMIKNSFNLS